MTTLTIHMRAGGSSLLSPAVDFLRDTFSDTNGKPLVAHVMDLGPGWTLTSVGPNPTALIESNALSMSNVSGESSGCAFSDPLVTNYSLSVDFTPQTPGMDGGCVVRFQDINNLWLFDCDLTLQQVLIYEEVSGSFTMRASKAFALSTGTTYHLEVRVAGSVITASVNGIQQLTFSPMTTMLSSTKCGLYIGGEAPMSSAVWDNFLVTN